MTRLYRCWIVVYVLLLLGAPFYVVLGLYHHPIRWRQSPYVQYQTSEKYLALISAAGIVTGALFLLFSTYMLLKLYSRPKSYWTSEMRDEVQSQRGLRFVGIAIYGISCLMGVSVIDHVNQTYSQQMRSRTTLIRSQSQTKIFGIPKTVIPTIQTVVNAKLRGTNTQMRKLLDKYPTNLRPDPTSMLDAKTKKARIKLIKSYSGPVLFLVNTQSAYSHCSAAYRISYKARTVVILKGSGVIIGGSSNYCTQANLDYVMFSKKK